VIGFGKHSAQRFPVSKIYYSYRLEEKNYGCSAAELGMETALDQGGGRFRYDFAQSAG
jgi:hypothetical protein